MDQINTNHYHYIPVVGILVLLMLLLIKQLAVVRKSSSAVSALVFFSDRLEGECVTENDLLISCALFVYFAQTACGNGVIYGRFSSSYLSACLCNVIYCFASMSEDKLY